MAENSIDCNTTKSYHKSFTRNLYKKDLRREKIRDFVASEFPQYGKWSVATFHTCLRIYSLLQHVCQTQARAVQHN